MQVNVQDAAPGTVELEVLVEADQYGKAVDEVVDQVVKSAQLPGFRKGKAPRSMVERSVNPETIRQRAIDRVLPDAYRDALSQSGLKPIAEPEIEILEVGDRELKFKLTVHKQPEVKPGEYKGLKLVRYNTEITDEDVEREIENARDSRPEYVSETEAPAEMGDSVLANVDVWRDGAPLEGAIMQDMEIRLGDGTKFPCIDDDLVGRKKGEVFDVEVQYPLDFQTESLQGLNCVWHVEVNEVRKRRLPELNDDFVMRVSTTSQTVDEYRAEVRQRLEDRARSLDEFSLESQALSQLLESSTIVFPHLLVDQQFETQVQSLERTLRRNRISLEQYAALQGVTKDALLQQQHDEAEQIITEYLLIHEIAHLEGIDPGPEEVDDQIEKEGRERGARPAVVELEKRDDARRSSARTRLIKERVMGLILENAEIADQRQSLSQAEKQESNEADVQAGA
ncbi:MAG TPA: trigger factor [Armatimonadota bacterium]|nr:trigger factor [Armatimonadota bacterium]